MKKLKKLVETAISTYIFVPNDGSIWGWKISFWRCGVAWIKDWFEDGMLGFAEGVT